MTTSIPGSAPEARIQQEAARSSVGHGGPTQERYESALERYVGLVLGDDPIASRPYLRVRSSRASTSPTS